MSHGEPADLTVMNSLGVDSQKDLLSDLCDVTDFRCFVHLFCGRHDHSTASRLQCRDAEESRENRD